MYCMCRDFAYLEGNRLWAISATHSGVVQILLSVLTLTAAASLASSTAGPFRQACCCAARPCYALSRVHAYACGVVNFSKKTVIFGQWSCAATRAPNKSSSPPSSVWPEKGASCCGCYYGYHTVGNRPLVSCSMSALGNMTTTDGRLYTCIQCERVTPSFIPTPHLTSSLLLAPRGSLSLRVDSKVLVMVGVVVLAVVAAILAGMAFSCLL